MNVPLKWWHHSPSTNSKVKTSLTRVYMNATFKLYLTEILKKPIPRLKLNFKFAWFGCCMHPPALSSSSWCIRTLWFPLFSCDALTLLGQKSIGKDIFIIIIIIISFSFSNNDPPLPNAAILFRYCREFRGKFESIRRPYFCHIRGMPINAIFQSLYFV